MTALPAEWFTPGAVIPVTPETVESLWRALKACGEKAAAAPSGTTLPTATVVQAIAALGSFHTIDWEDLGPQEYEILQARATKAAEALAAAMKANKEGA